MVFLCAILFTALAIILLHGGKTGINVYLTNIKLLSNAIYSYTKALLRSVANSRKTSSSNLGLDAIEVEMEQYLKNVCSRFAGDAEGVWKFIVVTYHRFTRLFQK